jgi:hypothetical protein
MKTKRFLLSAGLSLLLGACQGDKAKQTTLSDDKIAQIMADICVADAATTGMAGYPKDSLMHVYFKQVFEMHGTTVEAYENDLRILAKDLERMEMIVQEAEIRLTEGAKKPDTE